MPTDSTSPLMSVDSASPPARVVAFIMQSVRALAYHREKGTREDINPRLASSNCRHFIDRSLGD